MTRRWGFDAVAHAIMLALTPALSASCGSDEPSMSTEPEPEPGDDAEEPTTVTESVGPEGGRIELGRFSLEVPEGALEDETEITITQTSFETGEAGLAPVYDLLPDGQQFLRPVTVTVPLLGGNDDVAVYTGDWNAERMVPLETRVVSSPTLGAVAETTHFTHFSAFEWLWEDYSRCWLPVGPGGSCTISGQQSHVAWGINEDDPTRLVDIGEFARAQPDTTVMFSNVSTAVVVLEYFEVTNAENVPADFATGVRFDDLSMSDRVLMPMDYGTTAFRGRLADVSGEPRKRFFRYGHGHEWVFPDDRSVVMSYDFCIGYRLAGGPSEEPVCGRYEGRPLGNEPPKSRCGQACGECEDGLTCFRAFGGGPCEDESCVGFCAPPSCDGGNLTACQPLCDEYLGCEGESCAGGSVCAPGETCDEDGCCVPEDPDDGTGGDPGTGGSGGSAGASGGSGTPIVMHCTHNDGEAETGHCHESICFRGPDTEELCLADLGGRFICDQSQSGLGPCPRDGALAVCEIDDGDRTLSEYEYRTAIVYTQDTCEDFEGEKNVKAVCDGAAGTLEGPDMICGE